MSELALTLMLLVGAGLLVRSFARLQQQDPGLRPERLLTATVAPLRRVGMSPPRDEFESRRAAEREQMHRFFSRLVGDVTRLPGVRAAAATSQLPFQGSSWRVLLSFEQPPPVPATEMKKAQVAQARVVTTGYFRTMGIAVVRGRTFRADDLAGSRRVTVVNETLARTLWPGADPIGKRITPEDATVDDPPWLTIVGVVGDTRTQSLASRPESTLYVPFAQARLGFGRFWGMSLVVRTEAEPLAMAPTLRALVAEHGDDLPILDVASMESIMAGTLARPRFNLLLVGLFAAVAVVLAAVGLFAVISYSVSRRTHEIGVRVALGARPRDVLRMVLGRGLLLALGGIAVGLVGALQLARFLRSLLFEIRPSDPATLVSVSLLLLGVALLASYVPARRAMRLDPRQALSYE